MPKKNKVSEDVTNQWPGVLDEIDINVVPIKYIKAIEVSFTTGKVWIMDIDPEISDDEQGLEDLEASIQEMLEEYQDEIQGINFVVDIPRVKQDITNRTRVFLKKKQ